MRWLLSANQAKVIETHVTRPDLHDARTGERRFESETVLDQHFLPHHHPSRRLLAPTNVEFALIEREHIRRLINENRDGSCFVFDGTFDTRGNALTVFDMMKGNTRALKKFLMSGCGPSHPSHPYANTFDFRLCPCRSQNARIYSEQRSSTVVPAVSSARATTSRRSFCRLCTSSLMWYMVGKVCLCGCRKLRFMSFPVNEHR